MFNKNIEKQIRLAFIKVKKDITTLKDNTNEWIVFINSSQRDTELRLAKLEEKINKLERKSLEKVI